MDKYDEALRFFISANENGVSQTKGYMAIAANAIAKQIAKRPVLINDYQGTHISCPTCGNTDVSDQVYCKECGQRLG